MRSGEGNRDKIRKNRQPFRAQILAPHVQKMYPYVAGIFASPVLDSSAPQHAHVFYEPAGHEHVDRGYEKRSQTEMPQL